MSIFEPTPEILHESPTLFPLRPEAVVDGLKNLEKSSNNMLGMIVAARGESGPADSFYHNLPLNNLTRWHVEGGDFEEDAELLYKAGLLYGVDLMAAQAQNADLCAFKVDNIEAFNSSVGYLYESYRGLNDRDRTALNWRRQKAREEAYTGSDILTLANAALSETVSERLKEVGVRNPGSCSLAQHVGIVDGAILVDAYRCYAAGRDPERFDTPEIVYAPDFNGAQDEFSTETSIQGSYSYEYLEQLLEVQNVQDRPVVGRPLTGMSAIVDHVVRQCVQIGPNSFVYTNRVESVSVPRLKLRNLAGFIITGYMFDLVQGGLMHHSPGLYPASAALAGLAGVFHQRAMRVNARRRAEDYGVPLVVSPVEF